MKKRNNKKFFNKKISIKFIFLMLSSLLFFIVSSSISMAATVDATLFFNPSSTTAITGSSFNLVARVNPGSNTIQGVNSVQLDVTYNPSVLQLSSVVVASPFTQLSSPAIDNINGTLSLAMFIISNQVITTSDVATLTFTASAPGTNSPVNFAATSNAAVNDGNGTLVVSTRTGATVTVNNPDTTPPSFAINDSVSSSWLTTDTINVTVSDASGVASQFYGFSTDSTCNVSDTINTSFTSGSNFSIPGNHNDYLCVKATDSSSNSNVGYQLIGQLRTDNIGPVFTINDSVSASVVKTDTINATVIDTASGVASQFYGFSTDSTCNVSDTINTSFTSGSNFSIAGNHNDYLCFKATDNASNVTYQTIGQLNTDNTSPVLAEITPVSTPTSTTTPSFTFSSTEAGTITYGGGCSSITTSAVAGNNIIKLDALVRLASYTCTVSVTDTAGNISNVLSLNPFVITYRGDLNLDRAVSLSDLSILAADYGRTNWYGHADDINNDGLVNLSDLSILAADYGRSF